MEIQKTIYKWIAGAVAVLGAFFAKFLYDRHQQKKGEERVKDELREQTRKEELEFTRESERTAHEILDNNIPESWDDLRKLSEKATLDSKEAKKK